MSTVSTVTPNGISRIYAKSPKKDAPNFSGRIAESIQISDHFKNELRECFKRGNWNKAQEIYANMKNSQFHIDPLTYRIYLQICLICHKYQEMMESLTELKKREIILPISWYNGTVDHLINEGKIIRALEILGKLKSDNVPFSTSIMNSILRYYVQEKNEKSALEWLTTMFRYRVSPDIETYNLRLELYFSLNDETKVRTVLEEMNENGIPFNLKTNNLFMLEALNKKKFDEIPFYIGVIEKAEWMPNACTFNCMIDYYSHEKDEKKIEEIIKAMKALKFRPTLEICYKILEFYLDLEKPDLGIKLLKEKWIPCFAAEKNQNGDLCLNGRNLNIKVVCIALHKLIKSKRNFDPFFLQINHAYKRGQEKSQRNAVVKDFVRKYHPEFQVEEIKAHQLIFKRKKAVKTLKEEIV